MTCLPACPHRWLLLVLLLLLLLLLAMLRVGSSQMAQCACGASGQLDHQARHVFKLFECLGSLVSLTEFE